MLMFRISTYSSLLVLDQTADVQKCNQGSAAPVSQLFELCPAGTSDVALQKY